MQKQCSHSGEAVMEAAITDGVDSTQQRVSLLTVSVTSVLHCTNCRWDLVHLEQ